MLLELLVWIYVHLRKERRYALDHGTGALHTARIILRRLWPSSPQQYPAETFNRWFLMWSPKTSNLSCVGAWLAVRLASCRVRDV